MCFKPDADCRHSQPDPRKGSSIGWGLQFVEGISKGRVFCFGLICSIISTIIGVVWAAKKDDVQGGFALAAYIMMIFVFALGSLQAVFER